ncbi:MAG: type I secretion system permease/ATPase [Hyphomicrobiaceae bacterium]|nr:type I secretion system permease/ATPase [Hyphomicrobiaceae bacterium]
MAVVGGAAPSQNGTAGSAQRTVPGSVAGKARSPLDLAFDNFRPALVTVMIFSVFCNVLLFVGPLYMLQIYDRVLASRNEGTLVALTLIAVFLLLAYSGLDLLRSRLLVRAGYKFDEALNGPLFRSALSSALAQRSAAPASATRDMDTFREFWTGSGVITLCDAPFAPVFVAICFVFHPLLGVVALVGALVLFLLAVANEYATRASLTEAGKRSSEASHYATSSMANVEVIHALGMHRAIHKRWVDRHVQALAFQAKASDWAGVIMAATKFVRQVLQVLILGAGAWLAIEGLISPGAMIAASIMMGRALAPVEQSVSQWKSFMGARNAWSRLEALFARVGEQPQRTPLPRPAGNVAVEGLVVAAGAGGKPILRGISFQIAAGEVLAIIGPSAAGKSTLIRSLVGVWQPAAGVVRLDGSDLRHWDPERLGEYVGYLPQDIELFSGTVAENIARFRDDPPEKAVEAGMLSGAHALVQQLPQGYDTPIGELGSSLSGGQRQRIGLARAVYGAPSILVLDEPNAHLDRAGESILMGAIQRCKERGTTVIFATHTPQLLTVADKILALKDGQLHLFGPAKQVLAELVKPRVVSEGGEGVREPAAGAAGAANATEADGAGETRRTSMQIASGNS